MARGKRRERRRREGRSSNGTLPTPSARRAKDYFSLPEIDRSYLVFPMEEALKFSQPLLPIAIPSPTPKVALNKAAWQPTRVSEGRKKVAEHSGRKAARNARPIATQEQQRAHLPDDECVRRAQRTEVMFANNQAGKSGQKSPKWTEKSKIKCR